MRHYRVTFSDGSEVITRTSSRARATAFGLGWAGLFGFEPMTITSVAVVKPDDLYFQV